MSPSSSSSSPARKSTRAKMKGFMRDRSAVSSSSSPSFVHLLAENESSSPSSPAGAGGRRASHDVVPAAASSTTSSALDLQSGSLNLSVAFHSLLYHLCSFYEADPRRRQRLFEELCGSLSSGFPVWNSPAFHSRQFSSLRLHYQHAFERLVRISQRTVDAAHDPRVAVAGGPRAILAGGGDASAGDFFQVSRYESEYEEVDYLARGGFGAVYKARNKLDGCEYAVKKVLLKYCDRELCTKILREVTTLAKLSHPNVVCYKTAWLEPHVPKKQHSASVPADFHDRNNHVGLEETEESSWSPTEAADEVGRTSDSLRLNSRLGEESSSSSGVVFEASGDGDGDALPTAGPPRSMPRPISQNVLSIRELGDDDDGMSSDVPKVTGMAATPPNRTGCDRMRRFFSSTSSPPVGKSNNLVVPKATLVPVPAPAAPVAARSDPSLSSTKDRAVLYLTMQLCSQTLRQWLDARNARGRVSEPENARIFRQILKGTHYIHSKNIIHRDLKPKNIFLSDCGADDGASSSSSFCPVAQIGDFGLAKEELLLSNVESPGQVFDPPSFVLGDDDDDEDRRRGHHHRHLCRAESLHTSGVGTQAYAAPEQLRLGLIDEKSDVYSLGIILFELYFVFGTVMERSLSIKRLRERGELPEPAAGTAGSVRPEIRDLILAMTASERSERPSASELLDGPFSGQASRRRELEAEVTDLRKAVRERDEALAAKDAVIRDLRARLDGLGVAAAE